MTEQNFRDKFPKSSNGTKKKISNIDQSVFENNLSVPSVHQRAHILNKPATLSCRFVSICVTLQWTLGTKGLTRSNLKFILNSISLTTERSNNI